MLRIGLYVLIFLFLLESNGVAASVRHVELNGATDAVTVKVYPDFQSVFQFPEPVIRATVRSSEGYRHSTDGKTVLLDVAPRARPTSLLVETYTLRITLIVEMAGSMAEAEPVVVFERKPKNTLDRVVCEDGGGDVQLANFVGAHSSRTPKREWIDGSQYLRFRATSVTWTDDFGLISFEVTNRGDFSFPVARIEAQDARGNDQVRDVRVAVGEQVSDDVGAIPAGETARVSLLVNGPAQMREGMQVVLMPDGGAAPAQFSISDDDWGHVNKGRSTVLLSGGGGVLQLDRGGEGSLVGAAGIGGLFSYGMSANLSVDVGLGWLASGETEIAGLLRSDTLYRLNIGGRIQLTDEGWVPFLRGGGVLALVLERNGGDSSWGGRGFFQLGAGVTRWLSSSLVFGAEAQGEFGGSGGFVMVASAHFGVAWGGNEL